MAVPVTPELKQAFNPNDGRGWRYVDYAVRFEVINNKAQDEAIASAQEDTQISRIAQVTNRNPNEAMNFASFEPGGWPLDGSVVIPPRPDEMPEAEIGLVMPDLSDENGYYDTPQVITLTTQGTYNLLAVTLDFGFSPAADFDIDLYDVATLRYHHEVRGNNNRRYLMRQAVNNVNKIVITITRSAIPFRKARLVECLFGVSLQYDKSTGYGLGITEVIDPLNERVPASDMRLTVDNFAQEFNLFDPTSLYAFFQDRQELIPRIGAQMADGTMGYVPMGKYYLQRPQLKGNLSKLELKAVNLLGVLAESAYTKGVYKTASLAEFAEDIATDAGVTVSFPAAWSGVIMTAYIPSVTHAEAFRMLAQATGTLLRVNRDDVIEFLEIGQDINDTLTPNDYRADEGFAPSDDDIINTVQVEVTSLSVADEAEELAKAEGAGTHNIKYDPSTQHTASISGGAITSAQYYVDNAVITITGGTVTVSGKKLVSSKGIVTETIAQGNDRQYVYEVKGQPFIQPANAESVADHYLALKAQHRKNVKIQYRGYPYLEAGDVISFEAKTFETGPFIVTKNELRLGGGMTGTLEAREKL
jgi:hypothetical protein